MNILLVEDETRVADFINRGLKGDGFVVTHAEDGETALDYLKTDKFDVVLLDLMLPGISGHDVCRMMRARKVYTPVLMLTALDEGEEKVTGLSIGADDYLTKPFDFDELVARIHALSRRETVYANEDKNEISDVLVSGNIRYNKTSFEITVNEKAVELTEKEREILVLFLSNPSRVISRERILNSVWGANADPLTNVVDVYIGRLRKKLDLDKETLKNIRGVGYRYSPENALSADI